MCPGAPATDKEESILEVKKTIFFLSFHSFASNIF